jgi:virginiamycin B lyase
VKNRVPGFQGAQVPGFRSRVRGFGAVVLGAAFIAGSALAAEQQPAPPTAPPVPAAQGQPNQPQRPPRPGVSTPGVKRDIAAIKPIAVFPVPGNPDWQVVTDDAVWVTSGRKNLVGRLDPKTNTVVTLVETATRPCSGLVHAFGSVWVPICGEQDKPETKGLQRIDPKTNKITATLPVGPALSEGGITANADSVWMLSDMKGVLSRIDPETNRVVADISVPPGSSVVVLGEDNAIWVVSTEKSVVARVDPKTNLITDRIAVGPNPRFTTVGGGAIWTLNQGDGTVSKVDIKSKKLITSIDIGGPGGGGEIAYGEGFVWVTLFEIPLTQIDPDTNRVVKQWMGLGGDAVRVGHGSVWLSNIRQENVWRLSPKQQ